MTSTTSAPGNAEAADAMRAAVAAVPARMIAAWAAHDAEAFADLFVEDGTLILPGLYRKGRAEIRDFMAESFTTTYRGTRVMGEPIDVKVLGPGAVALITEGGVIAAGERECTAAAAIRASWILVNRDGHWRLAVYHNCPRDPRQQD